MHHTFITVALALSLGACTAGNGDEAILLTKNVVPGPGCTFASSLAEPALFHGTINAKSPRSYRLHPQMQSRISTLAGKEDQRTIITRGAHVDVEFANSADDIGAPAALTHFDTLFSAPLFPNGGVTDGAFEVVPAELIAAINTSHQGAAFSTELLVKVVVYGDMSGTDVTSQEFQFPVTVCTDCVLNILPVACPATEMLLNPGNPCNPYQDGTVDCCMAGDKLMCPAPVVTM